MPCDPLPIDAALPDVLAAVRTAGAVVVRAPTGAGKTTRVPPALVGDGLVLVLEPRRVAARAAARRMSATIDPGPVSAYLGGCPVVDSAGRTFPVEVRYHGRRADVPVAEAVAAAVRDVLDEAPGDVLAFLPGLREIRQTADALASLAD